MAREVWAFEVTIPAGTSAAAPYRQATTLPVRTVDTLEIVIPPGPSGLMGFAITMGGVNVLPVAGGTWLITDGETITWPLIGLPNSGAWQVSGYNTGTFDHSVYLRWLVDVVAAASPVPVAGSSSLAALSNQGS